MTDSDIKAIVQLELAGEGFTLFRNNCGALKNQQGRLVRYGLHPGSSDLIGWAPHRIWPHEADQIIARFVAIECKSHKDKLTPEQRKFLASVRDSGGISQVAQEQKDGRILRIDFEG